jgi:PAS domain S-box-containing protein
MSGTTQSEHYRIILDSITEGVFTIDLQWRITSFNRAAERITGISKDSAIGSPCKDILKADICEGSCALRKTIENGCPIANRDITIIDVKGNRKPISITTALLRNATGEIIGGVETFRDLSRLEKLRRKIRGQYEFEDIVSKNNRMLDLFNILPDVAESDSTVLIQGESGTGKELFARAIHHLSAGKRNHFVAVNCGALPDTLLESELFGYKAGAFTDAKKDKPGRFALADGGTLFLDEIGDVSKAMQVRLLRFLQERTYEPLGSVEPVRANVRIIVASNKNLDELVKKEIFRDDLYYRINVVKLEIPPLRDRLEDIPLLVEHLIEHFNTVQGKEISGMSDEALSCLMAYEYPGNVRELENIIERSFILCHSRQIERKYLPSFLPSAEDSRMAIESHSGSLKHVEASYLKRVLEQHDWNCVETAELLGMHKTTLYRKIKSLGLKKP